MFFPIGTDRPQKRPTLINHAIIVANVLMFVAVVIYRRTSGDEAVGNLYFRLWLMPGDVTLWGMVTYQFLHADFLHLFGNMLFLWVFGPNVEDRLGRIWYLLFYLLGGVAAGGLHLFFSDHPVVGASGSIAAVTGAYLVFFPRTHIRVLIFFFLIGVFWIPSAWIIGFAIMKDIVFQGLGGDDGVARAAHIGGYAFGMAVSMILLWLHVVPREPYDLFSIGRQAKRRRDFKELARKQSPWMHSQQPTAGAKRGRKNPPMNPVLAEAREKIATMLAENRVGEAIEAYKNIIDRVDKPLLPRQNQLDIANYLFQANEHNAAAIAYEQFLTIYKTDNEAPRVRLMLGLLYVRYLREPERAEPLLEQAVEGVMEHSQRELAQSLLDEARSGK